MKSISDPGALLGFKIHQNSNMLDDGPPEERVRSWKERLFTRPWKPWKKTKWVPTKVPSCTILHMPDGSLMMHPIMFREALSAIAADAKRGIASRELKIPAKAVFGHFDDQGRIK